MKTLNIGLIGYGFMGRTHSNAFLQAPRFFDLPVPPGAQGGLRRATPTGSRRSPRTGATSRRDRLAEADRAQGHRRHRHRQPERHPPRHRHRGGEGRQDGDVREAARRGRRPRRKAMVDAVEKAGVPNTVWYNYRRVPAVTLIKQLHRRGEARAHLPLPRQVPPGLDHLAADLPQGGEGLWRLDVAVAGSGVTGDLLAHCIDTALWLNGPIAEVTAMTETFVKERKHNLTGKVEPVGIDDASAVPLPVRERLAGDVRGDALRPRAQGALHPRDQRREGVGVLGPARPPPPPVLRPSRRGAACAAGAASTSPTAISPT